MPRLIALDSSPLWLLTMPSGADPKADRCHAWLAGLAAAGEWVVLPEVVDYEVRRELLLNNAPARLRRLDALANRLDYLPLGTAALRRAAEWWAAARRAGRPTADRHALDVDAILAAQATLAAGPGDAVVVATSNVGHLARFVDAQPWEMIA